MPTKTRVSFLYMDERYLDAAVPREHQVVSLSGLLIFSNEYSSFRDRFIKLLPGFREGKPRTTNVHASDFFRDRTDEEHFAFYDGLITLVNELGCRVYRRGMNFVPGHKLFYKNQQEFLRYCFRSMLLAVAELKGNHQIWPVMEIDRSKVQDDNFAGYVRWMDEATTYLNWQGDGVKNLIEDDLMVDIERFGEVHYVSKKSIVGSAVDCLAYLLHCNWLQLSGYSLTPYKRHIASLASKLDPSLVDDNIAYYTT